jgi:mRNA-degrading endonuclease toxin of MazEF toxin-antitoxin module
LENILPVEVFIKNTKENSLDEPSKILCDSPFTWDKGIRFKEKLGGVSPEIMTEIKKVWETAFSWE